MKFTYLILAHKNPAQLKKLISALDHEKVTFIIHIDQKCSIWSFVRQMTIPSKGNVFFCPTRKNVRLGRYSMINATMCLIDYFFKLQIRSDYIHLISGQDYPITNNASIFDFFTRNKGKNFIQYFSLSDIWSGDSKSYANQSLGICNIIMNKPGFEQMRYIDEYIPANYISYGGSQWWSLQYECLRYIYDLHLKKHEIFDFYRFTFVPDEMLFHTILLNSPFKKSIINSNLRFIKWRQGKKHPELIKAKDLIERDLGDILFARKFSAFNDTVLNDIDIKLGIKSNRFNETTKNCVISAVGKNSHHKKWINNEQQNFDLHLIVYDESFDSFKNDTTYISKSEGYKLEMVYKYLKNNPEIIENYDYFFIPDDDILIDGNSIIKLFTMMQEYDLSLAQPAISNSYYTYKHTHKQPDKILRYTNLVEMMMPCFSREALKTVLFTFNENTSGWGANHHWDILLDRKYILAIIDDIEAIHTRPIQSWSEKNQKELSDYLKKYNLSGKIYLYN